MAFVWLQWVLIVSSLASIAISSEVATNETAETAVVPQWAAPQPDEREVRGVGAMDSAFKPQVNSVAANNTAPVSPYTGGFYRAANYRGMGTGGYGAPNQPYYHNNNGPGYNGPGYNSPNNGPGYYNNGYGGNGNNGYNNAPGGYGPGIRTLDIVNLLIAAKFEEAQCEGNSKSNFTALLLIDRQKFCAKQTIVDNSVNTLTEKIANQFIVNELLYVVTLVNRANGHFVIDILAYVIRGPNSMEGKYVYFRIFVKEQQVFRKCSSFLDSSNIKVESIIVMIVELSAEKVAMCSGIPSHCFEHIRSTATTICQGVAYVA
jgi:hypothetical protein